MTTMPTRQLGKNGPQVSALGFGVMFLSPYASGKAIADEDRFKVLDRAIELGCTFFDSADIYGDNEDLLGKYFQTYPEQRKKVFLATKFAVEVIDEKTFKNRGDAQYVREASQKSLQRLGVNTIDLYYAHRIDKTVPIEETVSAMKELVDAGKVKYIGLSECSSDTLRRAHAVHPIACVQIEYSPFSLDIEREEIGLLKTCRELGVAIVCYSPLGRGMLTGQYRCVEDFGEKDFRQFMPRFSKENFPKNLQLVDQLAAIAKKIGCTPGQLTLAWILAQGDDFIPIPGTSKLKNLDENAGAIDVKLTKEEIEEIRQLCERADVVGERYPPDMCAELYGDSASKKD